jgi:protein lifeguard
MPKATEYMRIADPPIHPIPVQAHPVSPNQIVVPATSTLAHEFTILHSETSQAVRHTFVTKVYSILWVQILVTTLSIGACHHLKPLQEFMMSPIGSSLMICSLVVVLILSCLLSCIQDELRTCPTGALYLTLFTGCMAFLMGYIALSVSTTALLLSGLSTLGIFSGLSLYAIQTKYDYTATGGYLLVTLLGLLLFGFMVSFVHVPFLGIVYSSAGSLIFSWYIVYDTQLIVGGDHRSLMFHIDDYVMAAVSLYLDIVNLFLMLLDLISGRN